MSRTFVLGDIHGAFRALQQVIAKIAPCREDRLIFLGDYVDGWSQSAQVIDYLMDLDEKYDCLFIKGNHDIWCEEWLRGEEPNMTWLVHGGLETLRSYASIANAERTRHLEFFQRMLLYNIDDKNRLFIHAGFSSMHGPVKEHFAANFSWDRTLWEMALVVDERIGKDSNRYPKRLTLFSEIYIGHTPTTNYDTDKPMQACNVWNIDTGAAFTGRFTALDVDTKQYWQSDIVKQLYPGEKGRNK
jgi:serine/threonine protein phosphatase 1